jgi:hypothetical protein
MSQINQDPAWTAPIERNLALCRELGITVTTMYIVGFAHDSWSSVGATVALAKRYCSRYSVSVMTPYHGTAYRQQAIANGLLDLDAPYAAHRLRCPGWTLHLDRPTVQAISPPRSWISTGAGTIPRGPGPADHWARFGALALLRAPGPALGRGAAALAGGRREQHAGWGNRPGRPWHLAPKLTNRFLHLWCPGPPGLALARTARVEAPAARVHPRAGGDRRRCWLRHHVSCSSGPGAADRRRDYVGPGTRVHGSVIIDATA